MEGAPSKRKGSREKAESLPRCPPRQRPEWGSPPRQRPAGTCHRPSLAKGLRIPQAARGGGRKPRGLALGWGKLRPQSSALSQRLSEGTAEGKLAEDNSAVGIQARSDAFQPRSGATGLRCHSDAGPAAERAPSGSAQVCSRQPLRPTWIPRREPRDPPDRRQAGTPGTLRARICKPREATRAVRGHGQRHPHFSRRTLRAAAPVPTQAPGDARQRGRARRPLGRQ